MNDSVRNSLLADANIIRVEKEEGQNTSERIGKMFIDIIGSAVLHGEELPAELAEEVESIKQAVQDIENYLNSLHNKNASDAVEAVKNIFNQWDWFIAKGRSAGKVFLFDDSSLAGKIGSIVSGLGYIKDGNTGVTYTQIKQFVNDNAGIKDALAQLQASVANIARFFDEEGNIDYDVLSSKLNLEILNDVNNLKTSVASLEALWGTTDEDKNLLNWIKSAFRATANKYQGSATMFADMQTDASNTATSAVKTAVGIDENGNLIADSLLANTIQSGINSATSGFASKTYVDGAFTEMFTKSTSKNNSLLASVRTSVQDTYPDGDTSEGNKLKLAISSLVATPTSDELKRALAGVFVECSGDGEYALTKMISSNKNGISSAITTYVKNNKSALQLTASDINVDGDTTVAGKLSALEGMITTSAEANTLHAYSGDITNPFDEDSVGSHVIIENGTIEGYKVESAEDKKPELIYETDSTMPTSGFGSFGFEDDGSGYVANGNLKWDADGNVILNRKKVSVGEEGLTVVEILSSVYYDPNYVGPYNNLDEFVFGTHMSYRIMKNGFVVKGGYIENEHLTPLSVFVTSNTYYGKQGTTYTDSDHSYEVTTYNVYGTKISGFTSTSITNWLNVMNSTIWQEMFGNLIDPGTSVLFVLPPVEGVIRFDVLTPMLTFDNEEAMNIVYNYLAKGENEEEYNELKFETAWEKLQENLVEHGDEAPNDLIPGSTGYVHLLQPEEHPDRPKTLSELYGDMTKEQYRSYILYLIDHPKYEDPTYGNYGYYLWSYQLEGNDPSAVSMSTVDINVIGNLTITWPDNK